MNIIGHPHLLLQTRTATLLLALSALPSLARLIIAIHLLCDRH